MDDMQKSINDNRSKRNVIRDTIADLQEKLRQQYVAQNTAKMNMNQVEAKTKEIQAGYGEIQREQMEIRRQIEEAKADHNKIAEELKASEQDEKELEAFIQTRQEELEEWKTAGAGGFQRNWNPFVWKPAPHSRKKALHLRLWIV